MDTKTMNLGNESTTVNLTTNGDIAGVNVSASDSITVGNAVILKYDDINQCLNFIFE